VLSYGRSYRSSCSQVRGHPGGPQTSRYIVEHTFPEGRHAPVAADGAGLCRTLAQRNAEQGFHLAALLCERQQRRTFCAYEAPSPKGPGKAVGATPADRVTRVQELDPYSYI
jgi:hypothetical protein